MSKAYQDFEVQPANVYVRKCLPWFLVRILAFYLVIYIIQVLYTHQCIY